ncbi:hypothetical protein A9404_04095 [Halothiobacillus diazotrophicus]|uniref:CRISPR-associated endoribonuclease Cas2 n=1 Tax=Halothiobacillus diazotrophicus TaxID=1860122 RepID=A0A191ZFK9_9GAMM|nr:CRISPR-associated endonuclease Cas2 [Halothiobacillus diazotrophicus]ANJ66669.1 hypothetical protein A9404_04095 [Halothiobacillus diazotrophicus]
MKRRPALICYDIRDAAIRRRALRLLLGWRVDGQKSVHECRLTHREAQQLFSELCALIDPRTDHVLMTWIRPKARPDCVGSAQATLLSDEVIEIA